MAGIKETQKKLNNTLLFIVKLLCKYNIDNWFISYGTLLGIIRDNNCINNDDDIDIIIDEKLSNSLKRILDENNFELLENKKGILKTKRTDNFASIDFYCAKYDDNKKDFNDTWNRVIWSKCKDETDSFIHKEWNDIILNIPLNYEIKLIRRYGKKWRIPSNSKGIMPRIRFL
jgi:hypothetical protein